MLELPAIAVMTPVHSGVPDTLPVTITSPCAAKLSVKLMPLSVPKKTMLEGLGFVSVIVRFVTPLIATALGENDFVIVGGSRAVIVTLGGFAAAVLAS